MANSITKNQMLTDIKEMLKDADLTQLSAKKVRKQLEEKYETDLTERKKDVDELVMVAIKALENGAADHQSESDQEQEQRKTDNADNSHQNSHGDHSSHCEDDSDVDFDKPDDMGPPKKKKKTPSKLDDADLARKLQEEEEEEIGGRSGRRTRGGPSKKPLPHKKTPKKANKEGKPKKSNAYTTPQLLSPALAHILGTDRLPRSDVVKKMWEIARERNLFDPKNKQFIKCDEELYTVFGRKRVRMFGCMKYLSNHILSPKDEDQLL